MRINRWISSTLSLTVMAFAACTPPPPGIPNPNALKGNPSSVKVFTDQSGYNPFLTIDSVDLPAYVGRDNGFMALNIDWPQQLNNVDGFRVQTIPVETTKIRLKVKASGQNDIVLTLLRPAGSSTSRYLTPFVVVPAGTERTITAEAFDSTDKLVAYGEKTRVTILANEMNRVPIVLSATSGANPTPPPSSGGGGGGGGGSSPAPAPAPAPPTNQAPVISGINEALTISGATYSGNVTVVANDPEAAPLTYTWSVDGGTLLSNGSATVNWQGPVGTYNFTCIVSDGANSTTFTKAVTLSPNQPPQIGSITPTMSFVGPDHGGSLAATGVTDPEGDPLTYTWSVENNTGTLDAPNAATTNWTNAPTGSYIVTLQVSDGVNTTTEAVTVDLPNQTPQISDITLNNLNMVTPPNLVSADFNITANDPENQTLTYSWSVSNGTITSPNNVDPISWQGNAGNLTVNVTASDGQASTTFSKNFLIQAPNQAPNITDIDVSALTESTPGNHTGNITVNVTDPESDPLTYAWSVVSGGGTITSGTNVNPITFQGGPGNHTMTVTVNDGQASSTFTKNFTRTNNQAPVVSTVSNTITEGPVNQFNGNLTAVATDPESNPLTYTWGGANAAILQSTTGATVAINAATPPGTYNLTVTANDGALNSNTYPVALNLVSANLAPTVNSITDAITFANPNHSGTLTAAATDPESQAMTYAWTLVSQPGGATISGSGNPATINGPEGNYTVRVVANDGVLNSANFETSFTLTDPNNAPVVSAINDGGFTFTAGPDTHAATLTPAATDADSDPLTYTWSASGGTLSATTGNSVTFTAPAGTYDVTVQANDGTDLSNSFVRQITLVDPNNAPVVTGINDSGFTFDSGTAIHNTTLTPAASDADSDPLTYTWSASGGTLSATTGSSVTFDAPEGTYDITLQANDGTDVSNSFVRQITLSDPNVKPVISGVTPNLTFSNPNYTGTLAVTATDADSDPLTYTWQVIAGGSTLGSTTGQTINWTAAPGAHTIRVIANDGTENSDPYDYVTTLSANNSPVISGIDVDYQNGYIINGSEYQHNMTVNVTDPESDPLTYTWSVISGSPVGTFYLPSNPPAPPSGTINNTQQQVAYRAPGNIIYNVKVIVDDGTNTTEFTKPVLTNNQVPYMASANTSVSCGGPGVYNVPVTLSIIDPNGHAISSIDWTVNNGTLSGNTGTVNTWTINGAGTHQLVVESSDAYGTGTSTLNMTVGGCG